MTSVGSRAASLRSWHDDWTDLSVVVLGLGEPGFSAADTLVELGARVTILRDEVEEEPERILDVLEVDVRSLSASAAEEHLADLDAELVIVAAGPGSRTEAAEELLAAAELQSLPVWSDLELAWRLRDKLGTAAEWLLVTGADAPLTARLAESMMLGAERRVVAAAGETSPGPTEASRPVLDAIRHPDGFDLLIVETTAAELRFTESVQPLVSLCLPLPPLPEDWAIGVPYAETIGTVYRDTRVAAVYLREDSATEDLLREAEVLDGCRAIGLSKGIPGPSDLGVVEGILCDRAFLDDRRNTALELIDAAELAAAGLDRPGALIPVLAAAALARAVGVEPEQVRDTLRSSVGL